MSCTSTKSPRLFTEQQLSEGNCVDLDKPQAHYLLNVMRLSEGNEVRLFNRTQGEWLCTITKATRKSASLSCDSLLRPYTPLPDIDYLFAPLKSARLDYMAQKATELGAARLRPVWTDHCIVSRLNLERLSANVIEAAEQCNMVALPGILEPEKLSVVLDSWDPNRRLIFCDEAASQHDSIAALKALGRGPLAVLIGPEGGFSDAERQSLRSRDFVHPISLGPRIMRADTAAIAALSLVQATLGDWM